MYQQKPIGVEYFRRFSTYSLAILKGIHRKNAAFSGAIFYFFSDSENVAFELVGLGALSVTFPSAPAEIVKPAQIRDGSTETRNGKTVTYYYCMPRT